MVNPDRVNLPALTTIHVALAAPLLPAHADLEALVADQATLWTAATLSATSNGCS
ncbi:MAG: hypothetical protein M3460_24565 [Actinomycetota bacterium]|nr:hypothetical protein [Actinomycetota bacterium]